MVSLYEVLKDKYGDYYISNGKKHRIKTIDKNNEIIQNDIDKLCNFDTTDPFKILYIKRLEDMLVKYKIVNINDKRYIQFGG